MRVALKAVAAMAAAIAPLSQAIDLNVTDPSELPSAELVPKLTAT
jgi:hypothetical protein